MKHHHLLPSFLVCPQAACYDKNNRMLREEVQMSAKEVWSKYRLALPVFLCLAVAGFIIAMLLLSVAVDQSSAWLRRVMR